MILSMINWGTVANKIKISGKQLEKIEWTRALNETHLHIYQGTASEKRLKRRRAKNKVARRSRQINRG